MACLTGADAVELLVTSQRVREDVDAYRGGSVPALVVRPWVDIPLWTEFRCFVSNAAVTGITQCVLQCVRA